MSVKDWRPGFGHRRQRGEIFVSVIGNLGDANPFDYGGFVVYAIQDREYEYITGEFWHEPESEESNYTVYRFNIERNAIQDLKWVYGSEVGNWEAIAESCGLPVEEILRLGTSYDPLDRAQVYRMVGEYHGWENLDNYPEVFTREEMEKRWPEYA